MHIAITGASGFIGSQLVPRLRARGVKLTLLGRDPDSLAAQYSEDDVFSYDDMKNAFREVDAVLHLAVMNNDEAAPLDTFRTVNVEFPKRVIKAMRADGGSSRLIFASTLHATEKRTPYGITKAEAEVYLETLESPPVVRILRCPAVHGDSFAGRLGRILNTLPGIMRKPAFMVLAAMKPTAHIDRVAEAVLEEASRVETGERFVSDRQDNNLVYHGIRRLLDLLFAISILVFFWWLLLAIWGVVRFTSPGPGLFTQERVGKDGKSFICYKFRTMQADTKNAGTHTVSASNITSVGNVLRRTKLDELPQVINILRNDMSLVGPRPCLPIQRELIEERNKRGVLTMKSGITGYAQINDIDMSIPRRLAEADAYYLHARTLFMDIKIVFCTFIGAGQGDRTLGVFRETSDD